MSDKPDLINGYTKIANELLTIIPLYDFSRTQLNILIVLIRQTYGFGRKSHCLSYSFLAKATNTSKETVRKAMLELVDKNVVKVVSEQIGTKSKEYSLNKYYKKWSSVQGFDHWWKLTTEGGKNDPLRVQGFDHSRVQGFDHQINKDKENINKENIKKGFSISVAEMSEEEWQAYKETWGENHTITEEELTRLNEEEFDD